MRLVCSAALGGQRRHRRRSRLGAILAAGLATVALAACGDDSSSSDADSAEAKGPFEVKVVQAEFPTKQRLGQTVLLRLGVRNTGDETVPALTVTVSIAGEEGEGSSLPFAIRSGEPGLAQPDRPVWVLSEKYPRLSGETERAVWKLTASRSGSYRVLYAVGAGLSGETKAETASGVEPGGSFRVRIVEATPEVVVSDSGEVEEVQRGEQTQANR